MPRAPAVALALGCGQHWSWPWSAIALVTLHALGPLRASFRLDANELVFEGSRPHQRRAIAVQAISAIRALPLDGRVHIAVVHLDGSHTLFRCRSMSDADAGSAAELLAIALRRLAPAG